MKSRITLAAAATLAMLAGCAKSPEPAAPEAAAPAAAPAEAAPVVMRSPAPADAVLYIVSPKDGDTITGPVKVVFGLSGMGVAPAGVEFENAGHHHLLIDTALPEDLGIPLPSDDQHKHFGKGQTETTVTLAPGKHTLQLVLGNHLHIPFDPLVASQPITITVK